MQCDGLQVQPVVKFDGGDVAVDSGGVLLSEGKGSLGRTDGARCWAKRTVRALLVADIMICGTYDPDSRVLHGIT